MFTVPPTARETAGQLIVPVLLPDSAIELMVTLPVLVSVWP